MPVEKSENGSWPHPARLPLGGGWGGHCTAPDHEGEIPQQSILETLCNLGYAGGCIWSPKDEHRTWDAVRFAVCAPPDSGTRLGRDADGDVPLRVLRLRYVCEKSHLPVEHGDLEFDLTRSAWVRAHDDSRVQKMAECFLDSYLKRKS